MAAPAAWCAAPICPDHADALPQVASSAPDISDAHHDLYSTRLNAANEPALWCRSPSSADEAYRFLWLRSFLDPVSVSIWREGRAYWLRLVVLDGGRSSEPAPERMTVDRKLGERDWAKLRAALDKAGFWGAPAVEPDTCPPVGRPGYQDICIKADGADWFFEGLAADYHAVDRWSPDKSAMGDLGRTFLALAGLKPDGAPR